MADTLRIGVERGDYPEAKGREEEWIAERMAKLFHPGERHEQLIADGRCIQIEERMTADGGIVGLRIDITELKQRESSFRLLFDANPLPMIVCALDDEHIIDVNDAARSTTAILSRNSAHSRSAICRRSRPPRPGAAITATTSALREPGSTSRPTEP
jgi:PAS domain-containing protein